MRWPASVPPVSLAGVDLGHYELGGRPRRFWVVLIPEIIFARISGSAHRSFAASPIFARLVGVAMASFCLWAAMGSAHRARMIALCCSRRAGLDRPPIFCDLGMYPPNPLRDADRSCRFAYGVAVTFRYNRLLLTFPAAVMTPFRLILIIALIVALAIWLASIFSTLGWWPLNPR